MSIAARLHPSRWLYLSFVWATIFFVLVPLATTVWVAFFSNKILSFPAEGYTASWFGQALTLEAFRSGFLLSFQVAIGASILAVCLGVPAAIAIARHEFRGREFINTILMSPLMIPAIVAGTAIYLFYIEVQIRSDVQLVATVEGLTLAHTLIAIPWVLRLLVASLSGLDPAIEEASLSLGASRLTTFFRVTLPSIRPGITAGVLFGFIASFGDLEKSLLLVGPGRITLPIAMINYLEYRTDPTIMAVATIQVLIIAVALIVSDRFVRLGRTF
ncbi:ABC transporter permease [Bradyrhizobium sp.]|uniref:ABC transporter permease n=1 Tax=Bradyrhizobium sp. TaxID=376 RepID=UPI0039E2B359